MTNTDIGDLHGVFPTPLRWSAENGVLGYSTYDPSTGERDIEPIELGSNLAKFVMDLSTRERGYGLIRTGLYDMRLEPVGAPPPPWPGDDDFKPAIGCWLWNPAFGEFRLETNAAILRTAISAVWDQCRTFKEAAQGQQPIIHFVDRQERLIRSVGKTFWAPVISILGWVERDRVPPFALREPTVKPPPALDSQVRHPLLEQLRPEPARTKGKGAGKGKGAPPKRDTLNDMLDDEIPEL
jgi:hypothetical protein